MTTLLGTGNPDCKLQIHLTLKSPKPRFAHSATTTCYRLQQVLFLQLMLESKAFIRLWFQTCWLVPLNPSSARSPFPIGLSSFLSKKPQHETALEACEALSFHAALKLVTPCLTPCWRVEWRVDSWVFQLDELIPRVPPSIRGTAPLRLAHIQSHGTMMDNVSMYVVSMSTAYDANPIKYIIYITYA